jgi:fibronectin type 3 domain-containing protein
MSKMNPKRSILGATLTLALVVLLTAVAGCATSTAQPLPGVEGITAELGANTPGSSDSSNTIVVSWTPNSDSRVQGYAIYRAEQGVGADVAEKSAFTLQAITSATKYVDDEVHTTQKYPTTRYFYKVCVVAAAAAQGPLSPEVSIEYTATP